MDNVMVVGAGLSGCVFAREIVDKLHKKVTIVERRNHIAGNIYDEWDKGILIQRYGPHYIATYHWEIVEYLKRFTDFYEYPVRAQSYLDGKYIERPYNFRSLQQLLGSENSSEVISAIRKAFPNWHRCTLGELMQCEDRRVSDYGKLLYEKIFAPYCEKQWGMKVEDISPEVINRTDMVLGYETQLDDTDFQYLPSEGYTKIIERMIDHPLISVRLNEDALEHISFDDEDKTVLYGGEKPEYIYYTGELDLLFHNKFGELPYISRYFTYDYYEEDKILPCAVITYPSEREYIRQTEFSQFNPVRERGNIKSIVQTEYPLKMDRNADKGNEPYYPVLNDDNEKRHDQYKKAASEYTNLIYGGRLADFRYYDMDTTINNALDVFKKAFM